MVAKGTIMVDPQDLMEVGEWSWNRRLLESKIIRGEPDECWGWNGSRGPYSNLFGGKKNGRPQMSQTSRFIFMTETGQDAAPYQIQHTCSNRYCTNSRHFRIKKNPFVRHEELQEEKYQKRQARKLKSVVEETKPLEQIFKVKQEPIKEVKRWWQI